jgi:CRP-like cAMP-binding protein
VQLIDPTPGRQRLVRKLESIAPLGEEERRALMELPMVVRHYADGQDLVRDGDRPHECCLILEGFACRYKLLDDGRKQILSFHTRATFRTCRACISA